MSDYVTIHNWVEHAAINKLIADCDIFIYASSIETSGFGLMEGMVQGSIIACNNESCMPEILGDGGILFDVFSPEDIANKLSQLIESPELRYKVSSCAFDISKNMCGKTV